MKVKGINKAYSVEIKKSGREGISITLSDIAFHMMSVIIDRKEWDKIVEEISGHQTSSSPFHETSCFVSGDKA